VVSNPTLPGLELHIPKGTVITDYQGKVVREVSITSVPLNQPPFPLPPGVRVPIYFTIQPGAAYLSTNGGWGQQGAQLYYPNSGDASPGSPTDFWNYDPDAKGWYVYGQGKVNLSGTQIVPNPGVVIYEFSGAMVAVPSTRAATFPGDSSAGDPVDLSTGLFVYRNTDLTISDVIPISLTRTYRQADSISRAFGVGTTHPYDIFLVGDVNPWTYQELVLPDGRVIRYDRISPGVSATDAVYIHSSTRTPYYGSTISWNGNGWNLTMTNGTVYVFPDGYLATRAQLSALIAIHDRYNNTLSISRDSNGNITQITTPNGRWVKFTYDSSYRITQAQDNINRTVGYAYDSGGRLTSYTDANGGTTAYTYDSNSNMTSITDTRGIRYITNQYDSNNRVIVQTMADGSTYQFSYTLSGSTSQTYFATFSNNYTGAGPGLDIMGFRACEGCTEGYTSEILQVDITDQRGFVRRVVFSDAGYKVSDTHALGQPEEQTIKYQYTPDNLLSLITDPLDRNTVIAYGDINGNPTQITQLSGTDAAITTNATFELTFNQPTSFTDPLNHTTNFAYDSNGSLVGVIDPLNQETRFTYNAAGQVLTATDPLNHTTSFAYDSGDLVSITDPLGRNSTRFFDSVGRLVTIANPLGQSTRFDYDALNRITKLTDPLGNATNFSYDGNGNLLSFTDANSHTATYTYDSMGRLVTRTDPLSNSEQHQYDAAGNLSQFTDRRGKITTYKYDSLNRRTFAGYGTILATAPTYDSTISYGYDPGNRLSSVVDSVTGTITHRYDGLDRLISEQTPQGAVSYVYDAKGRRTQMTVAGQAGINYAYDGANRLLQITQGSSSVSIAYDSGNRRTSLTLPNGIVVSYGYDNASQLTGVTYTNGGSTLGALTYAYDLAGRRIQLGGSYAQTALPLGTNNTAYNADNQLAEWGTAGVYYDANGNMTSDGLNSFTWDSRNQLSSMNFGANSFQYDGLGRRVGKTISGTTTNYLYDGANIVQELSGGSPTANFLEGNLDEFFLRTNSSGASNFLRDALGSTLALTDSSGGDLVQYAYEPFGNTVFTSGSSSNEIQYAGRENDGTGLFFNRARYYNPVFQRFVSEDPIGIRGGANRYAYVHNSPTSATDPTGLQPSACPIADAIVLFGFDVFVSDYFIIKAAKKEADQTLEIKIPQNELPGDIPVPNPLIETLGQLYDQGLDTLKEVTKGMFETYTTTGCAQI
jgi:RHS repeat-associated protein